MRFAFSIFLRLKNYIKMTKNIAIMTHIHHGDVNDTTNLNIPTVRQGHSLSLHENKQLYVFSGRIPNIDTNNYRTYIHDFWSFDLNTKIWKKIELGVDHSPCARHSHSSVIQKDKIYIYGGSNNQCYLGDLWSYDVKKNEWKLICDNTNDAVKYAPSPRHGHSASVWNDLMIVFGGKYGYNSTNYFNDIYAFDMKKEEWIEFKTENNHLIPFRCWHTCTVIKNLNLMILFAGFRILNGEIYYNDTWILDLQTMKWQEITKDIKGTIPHIRNRHIALLYESISNDQTSYILFHSGNYMDLCDVWIDDVFLLEIQKDLNFKWINLSLDKSKITANVPTARGHHSAAYKSDTKEILFFGGEFERKRFNDIISIKLNDQ